MMAAPGHGMLNLIDNREISPAPVSHFAPKMRGPSNMNHNRVTLPFKRKPEAAGRPVFDKLSLKRAAKSTWEENFKLSKKEPKESILCVDSINCDTLKVSLSKLLQANGDGTLLPTDENNLGIS